jgi:hypothetical protein
VILCPQRERMQNRVFFPQSALDQWIVDEKVELVKGELTILPEGRRYALEEAVRVMREVSGAGDGAKLIGRVRTRAQLEQQGAEIVESSMLFGDAAYDVEPGWVGAPIGPLPGGALRTEEELLARFVARRT